MFSSNFTTALKAGRAFSWTNATYDYDAADTILLVANTHTGGWKLNIERVDITSDTATQVDIHCPAYPTLAGTVVTGVNLNRDASDTAVALAYCDETGNSQANVINSFKVVANTPTIVELPEIRLGYQKCIAVDFVTAGTAGWVTVWGYYSTS
jgi:hypothetical protein